MPAKRSQRKTITVDLPQEQIDWLDQQAESFLVSRSGFVRQLIARLMESGVN